MSTGKPINPWTYKPWWCQPWSILLTGISLIAGCWWLSHCVWLTVLIAVPVLIWMSFFVLIWPRLMLQSGLLSDPPNGLLDVSNSENR
ncbi:MAG: hypothetical protein HC866_10870 [Leptolyngbyaceae cyanobacterium RU_5_1]|nr:hypothetical protein [Leptolyngbyaceae cyanobacterium RU_5_1]